MSPMGHTSIMLSIKEGTTKHFLLAKISQRAMIQYQIITRMVLKKLQYLLYDKGSILRWHSVPGLPTDPDDYYEDTDIIVDQQNTLSKLEALIFQWKQHRENPKDDLYKFLF